MDERKQTAMLEFLDNVNRLRSASCRKNKSMTEDQFDEHILRTHFADCAPPQTLPEHPQSRSERSVSSKLYLMVKVVFILFLIAILYSPFREAVGNLFMKHIQSCIYSGMSVWRLMTVPLIRLVPALSELYDESCLLENPLFQIQDMDCRPCQDVLNVLNLDDLDGQQDVIGGGVPHVFKNIADRNPITVERLYEHYLQNKEDYRLDAFRVVSTHPLVSNLDDLFAIFFNHSDNQPDPWHTIWRCNRMNPVRLLRQLIHHPKRLPRTGMSIERFLAIDTAGAAPYSIPDPECSNVFIHQVLGSRTMVLRPTSECLGTCRTISVRLNVSQVLMYDWWYWKPVSMADAEQLAPSISYIGAYC